MHESAKKSNKSYEICPVASLQNQDPGDGAGSTSRGWSLVGLGVGWVGFRDQGVETGRFRSMYGGRSWI